MGTISVPPIQQNQGGLLKDLLPQLLLGLVKAKVDAHAGDAEAQRQGLQNWQQTPDEITVPGAAQDTELQKVLTTPTVNTEVQTPALDEILQPKPAIPTRLASTTPDLKQEAFGSQEVTQPNPTKDAYPKGTSKAVLDQATLDQLGLRKQPAQPLIPTYDPATGKMVYVPKTEGATVTPKPDLVSFTDENNVTSLVSKKEGVLGKKFVATKGYQPTSLPGVMFDKDAGQYVISVGDKKRVLSSQEVQDYGLSYIENKPTETTKTMQQMSPKVLNLIADAKETMGKVMLGPAAGRYQDVMTNKIGAPNPDFKKLSTTLGLLETSLMRMHVGARGGVLLMDHFHKMMDAGKQSPENLKASLDAIEQYANEVGAPMPKMGRPMPGSDEARNPKAADTALPRLPGESFADYLARAKAAGI